MQIKPLRVVKWVFLIIIALFVAKLLFGWFASKWPNKLTNAINTVVQTA